MPIQAKALEVFWLFAFGLEVYHCIAQVFAAFCIAFGFYRIWNKDQLQLPIGRLNSNTNHRITVPRRKAISSLSEGSAYPSG